MLNVEHVTKRWAVSRIELNKRPQQPKFAIDITGVIVVM